MRSTLYTMSIHDSPLGRFAGIPGVTFADQVATDVQLAADAADGQDHAVARQEKLARLKTLIEENRYFVSSEELAEKMVATMLCRGSRRLH